jgi:hypothetical protein
MQSNDQGPHKTDSQRPSKRKRLSVAFEEIKDEVIVATQPLRRSIRLSKAPKEEVIMQE